MQQNETVFHKASREDCRAGSTQASYIHAIPTLQMMLDCPVLEENNCKIQHSLAEDIKRKKHKNPLSH